MFHAGDFYSLQIGLSGLHCPDRIGAKNIIAVPQLFGDMDSVLLSAALACMDAGVLR